MKQVKIFKGNKKEDVEKELNDFYAESNIKGYHIIRTELLRLDDPMIIQVIFDVEGKR